MAEVKVTDKTFEEKVVESKIPALVDFWAIWCQPCQMQNPILEEVAKEYEGKAIVAKLNVDENQQSAVKYGVMSIPTLMLFKNGKIIKQMIGVQSKETLKSELDKLIQE